MHGVGAASNAGAVRSGWWLVLALGVAVPFLLVLRRPAPPGPREEPGSSLTPPGADVEVDAGIAKAPVGPRVADMPRGEGAPPTVVLPAAMRPLVDAVLSCVDAENGMPLAGVQAFDQERQRHVAASDGEGRLRLDGVAPGHLILHGSGVLAALLPDAVQTRLATSAAAEVALYRDRYTMPVAVEAVWPDGQPRALQLVCAPTDAAPEGIGFPLAQLGPGASVPPALRRAWALHVLLVDQAPSPGLAWHLGRQSLPHRLPASGGELRFAQARTFLARAWAAPDLVATATFTVQPHARNRLALAFTRGVTQRLRVVSDRGGPLAGARVLLRLAAPVPVPEREETSDARGEVAFECLVAGEVASLVVTADGHARLEPSITVSATLRELRAMALPSRELALLVREAASGRALDGVTVTVGSVVAHTDATGAAMVRLSEPGLMLSLHRDGYLDYRETLPADPAASLPTTFAMIPADRARQLALGLVAAVEGAVVDGDGRPRPGVRVMLGAWLDEKGRLASDSLPPPGFTPAPPVPSGRMILAGQWPDGSAAAVTDERGRFVLYAPAAGRAVITLADGDTKRELFLVLGRKLQVRL